MRFREYYKKTTKLRFNSDTHIHHLNKDRKDNSIENLVHVHRLNHLRFHNYINVIISVERTLIVNNWTIDELKNDNWLQSFCIPFRNHNNWIKRLLSSERIILKNIGIRNKKININNIPVLITDSQREIIEIYKNKL